MATRAQIYREILREYDALRTRKAAELRERKESLYERFPRLAEIEEELSLLGISAARTALGSPEGIERAVQELKGRQHKLAAERLEIFEAAGISPRVLEMEYDCEKCHDTGYIGPKSCLHSTSLSVVCPHSHSPFSLVGSVGFATHVYP